MSSVARLWSVLLLDSGANKCGIMSAFTEIKQQYEDMLDTTRQSDPSVQSGAVQSEETREDKDAQESTGGQRREHQFGAVPRRRVEMAIAKINYYCISCDEGSLPAVGVQMAETDNRAVDLYGDKEVMFDALSAGNGAGFSLGTIDKLHTGGRWSRTVNEDQNRFHMMSTTL